MQVLAMLQAQFRPCGCLYGWLCGDKQNNQKSSRVIE